MGTASSTPQAYQHPLMAPESPASRRITIQHTSKSVSGSYPLYDLLSVSTESGSISLTVTPHSASSRAPSEPARLELKSTSGSVRVGLSQAIVEHHIGTDEVGSSNHPPGYSPALGVGDDEVAHHLHAGAETQHCKDGSGIPKRDYITSVSTRSGSIHGTFPLGARTGLDSYSGSLTGVELVVMPINVTGPRRLSTMSTHGSQSLRIVEDSLWADKTESWWEEMESRHESRSGSLHVKYPQSWEGTIHLESGSGSLSVTGRGVQIVRKEKGRLVAEKGDGGSGKVILRTTSGSVNLKFE